MDNDTIHQYLSAVGGPPNPNLDKRELLPEVAESGRPGCTDYLALLQHPVVASGFFVDRNADHITLRIPNQQNLDAGLTFFDRRQVCFGLFSSGSIALLDLETLRIREVAHDRSGQFKTFRTEPLREFIGRLSR